MVFLDRTLKNNRNDSRYSTLFKNIYGNHLPRKNKLRLRTTNTNLGKSVRRTDTHINCKFLTLKNVFENKRGTARGLEDIMDRIGGLRS